RVRFAWARRFIPQHVVGSAAGWCERSCSCGGCGCATSSARRPGTWRAFMTSAVLESCAIGVFARAPEPGQTKTRLIPRLGADGAAQLHSRLVCHTVEVALASDAG